MLVVRHADVSLRYVTLSIFSPPLMLPRAHAADADAAALPRRDVCYASV